MGTVLHDIAARVLERPDAPGLRVVPDGRQLTYRQLWHACAQFPRVYGPELSVAASIVKSSSGEGCSGSSIKLKQRVAVLALCEVGFDLPLAQVALLLHGFSVVHVNPADPRVGALVADCAPAVVLTNTPRGAEIMASLREESSSSSSAASSASGLGAPVNTSFALLDARRLSGEAMTEETTSTACDDADASGASGAAAAATDAAAVVTNIRPADVCSVYYTSGSTGVPKGCVLRHAAVRSYSLAKNSAHGVCRDSRVLLVSSPTFDPCLGDTLATLCAGACLVVPRETNVRTFLAVADFARDVLARFNVTHCQCTPAFWDAAMAISQFDDRRPDDNEGDARDARDAAEEEEAHVGYRGLETLALGGEPLERFWPVRGRYWRLLNTYGVTECFCYQSCQEIPGTLVDPAGDSGSGVQIRIQSDVVRADPGVVRSVGAPLDGNGLCLIPFEDDAEAGDDSRWIRVHGQQKAKNAVDVQRQPPPPPSAASYDPSLQYEIAITGAQLGRYLNRPAENDRAFRTSRAGVRFYRTGDLGALDEKHRLVVTGRIDFQLKIGGERIELEEIEAGVGKTELVDAVTCIFPERSRAPMWSAAGQRSDIERQSGQRVRVLVACCKLTDGDLAGGGAGAGASAGAGSDEDADTRGCAKINAKVERTLRFVLRRMAKRYVPEKFVPAEFMFFAPDRNLPMTANDKIDRDALAKMWFVKQKEEEQDAAGDWSPHRNEDEEDAGDESPRDELLLPAESFIASVWRQELGLAPGIALDRGDNFFEMGGDSLSALRVCRRLLGLMFPGAAQGSVMDNFGDIKRAEFSVTALMQHPTLEAYARQLSSAASELDLCAMGVVDAAVVDAATCAPGATTATVDDDVSVTEELLGCKDEARSAGSAAGVHPPFDDDATRHLFVAVQNNLPTFVDKLSNVLCADPNGTMHHCVVGNDGTITAVAAAPPAAKEGAKISKVSKEDRIITPLHVASLHGFTEIVRLLVSHPATNVGQQDKHGVPPFFISKHLPVFRLIHEKQRPGLLTARDDNRQTVLHFAARNGHAEILRYVLFGHVGDDASADCSDCDCDDADLDASNGIWPARDDKRLYNSTVDWRDRWHRTPLAWAILNGHGDAVRLLLRAGADPDAKIREKAHAKGSHLPNESARELAVRIGFLLDHRD